MRVSRAAKKLLNYYTLSGNSQFSLNVLINNN